MQSHLANGITAYIVIGCGAVIYLACLWMTVRDLMRGSDAP